MLVGMIPLVYFDDKKNPAQKKKRKAEIKKYLAKSYAEMRHRTRYGDVIVVRERSV
jgi:hypothetical protein